MTILLTELAESIQLIHPLFQVSRFSGFNPLVLIKTVNYLHSLGFHKSLGILKLYCYLLERIEDRLIDILPNVDVDVLKFCVEPYKIFLIARLLFFRKDREIVLPRLGLGQPDLQPREPSLFPWFPLHIYQDISFCLLMRGYTLFGQAQSPDMYLDWCAKDCQLREAPLLPSNDPLASVDEFIASEVWKNLEFIGAVKEGLPSLEKAFCRMLRLQALRTVFNVYPISEQDEIKLSFGCQSTEEEIDRIWQHHRQTFASLKIF